MTLLKSKALADEQQCDVFINHRGVDTKRSVAGLLYDRLVQLNLRPFLDNRTMEPGDKLYDIINSAVLGCEVGIAIFSPRYCESFYCLHELTLMVESRKKLIPIFCDVKPSSLRLQDNLTNSTETLARFNKALQEAKDTVGLSFDSQSGNWSDLLTRTADIVVKSLNHGRGL
ncbi:Toll/interleukin-1 receptor homology (TIR) domain-containing protein [Dioscorea alata]|uniref:Toll/interleukin-1 receptor homology (TIR) domain-containing protein n=1 Tax=Dioscorea alata TaxID=55571 RepID=A0ACB7VP05_DIOAL|nr:Toll/interleukin-1 receptor homology (TIR) domain-containing protein [Dioscorea alata]